MPLLVTEQDAKDKLSPLCFVGEGAYCSVYSACLGPSRLPVALKLLKLKHASTREAGSLAREHELLAGQHHINIASCLGRAHLPRDFPGLRKSDGLVAIVLELAACTLADVVAAAFQPSGKRPPPGCPDTPQCILPATALTLSNYSQAQALQWLHQLASALAYLHTSDPIILHRDVKLENVCLMPTAQQLRPVASRRSLNRPSTWLLTGGQHDAHASAHNAAFVQDLRACLTDFGLATSIGRDRPVLLRRRMCEGRHHNSQAHEQDSGPSVPPQLVTSALDKHDVFFTLDQSGVARSVGGFLSPMHVLACTPQMRGSGNSGNSSRHSPSSSLPRPLPLQLPAASSQHASLSSPPSPHHSSPRAVGPRSVGSIRASTLRPKALGLSSCLTTTPATAAAAQQVQDGTRSITDSCRQSPWHGQPASAAAAGAQAAGAQAAVAVAEETSVAESTVGAVLGRSTSLRAAATAGSLGRLWSDLNRTSSASHSEVQHVCVYKHTHDGPQGEPHAHTTSQLLITHSRRCRLQPGQSPYLTTPCARVCSVRSSDSISMCQTPADPLHSTPAAAEATAEAQTALSGSGSDSVTVQAASQAAHKPCSADASLSGSQHSAVPAAVTAATTTHCPVQPGSPVATSQASANTASISTQQHHKQQHKGSPSTQPGMPSGNVPEALTAATPTRTVLLLPNQVLSRGYSGSLLHSSPQQHTSQPLPGTQLPRAKTQLQLPDTALDRQGSADKCRWVSSLNGTSAPRPPASSLVAKSQHSQHGLRHKRAVSHTTGELLVVSRDGQMAELVRQAPREFAHVWALTGETGSLLSMSPEVFRQQPYNASSDVFSWAMVAWEVMARKPLSSLLPLLHITLPRDFAMEVSVGFRPPRPAGCPDGMWQLLQQCWQQDPLARPSARQVEAEVKAQLQAVLQSEGSESKQPAAAAARTPCANGAAPSCACVVM